MDEDGGEPDCLGLVISDISERFDAENRFEAMFYANPAPALIIRIADRRYVLANQGFLDLSGYTREQIIGKTLFDLDLLAEVDRKAFVRECVADGRTVPQLEAELPLAGGDRTLVLLAGQPIEVANENCLLFTFADLEPKRRAEQALRSSERHFSSVFDIAPVAMVVTEGDDNRIVRVNEAFQALTGYSAQAIDRHVADDLQLWNDASRRKGLEKEIRDHGGFRGHDVRLLRKNGKAPIVWCPLSGSAWTAYRACYGSIRTSPSGGAASWELVEAIEAVMKDANWLGRSIIDKLATLRNPRPAGAIETPAADLSKREREVLELICQDMDDAAMAERLGLSRNTVRNHVARLNAKIGVNHRSAAVVWARERGVGGRMAIDR